METPITRPDCFRSAPGPQAQAENDCPQCTHRVDCNSPHPTPRTDAFEKQIARRVRGASIFTTSRHLLFEIISAYGKHARELERGLCGLCLEEQYLARAQAAERHVDTLRAALNETTINLMQVSEELLKSKNGPIGTFLSESYRIQAKNRDMLAASWPKNQSGSQSPVGTGSVPGGAS